MSQGFSGNPLSFGLAAMFVAVAAFSSAALADGKNPTTDGSKPAPQLHLKERLKATARIKAPSAVVWSTVLDFTRHDPEVTYFKPLTHDGGINTLEEGFKFPTMFGEAECKLHFTEAAPNRIDFHMLESEDLKAMEGSWVIAAAENGRDSILELTSYVDPYMFVPRPILNAIIQHRLDTRVAKIKRMAERANSKLSQSQSSQAVTR